MSQFFRFPHTPHLLSLGDKELRHDKVLSSSEADSLLEGDVVVEEKVDGANLGFSVARNGELLAQNRGNYLNLASVTGQWKPLNRWLISRRRAFTNALSPNLIFFGEWCYAVHSVRYTRLPDWFLAFDVYDRECGKFWSVDRRDELASFLGVQVVPRLGAGHFSVTELESLSSTSVLTDGPAEGVYVRKEESGWLAMRAKLIRREFAQSIEDHWSNRILRPNSLVSGELRVDST